MNSLQRSVRPIYMHLVLIFTVFFILHSGATCASFYDFSDPLFEHKRWIPTDKDAEFKILHPFTSFFTLFTRHLFPSIKDRNDKVELRSAARNVSSTSQLFSKANDTDLIHKSFTTAEKSFLGENNSVNAVRTSESRQLDRNIIPYKGLSFHLLRHTFPGHKSFRTGKASQCMTEKSGNKDNEVQTDKTSNISSTYTPRFTYVWSTNWMSLVLQITFIIVFSTLVISSAYAFHSCFNAENTQFKRYKFRPLIV